MTFLTQQFLAAIRICSGELPIKRRLANAWIEHLDNIKADEMPQCQRQKFLELREAMYEREPLPDELAPQASIRKMSVQQVATYTNMIVAIYAELIRVQNDQRFAVDGSGSNVGSSVGNTLEDRMMQRLN